MDKREPLQFAVGDTLYFQRVFSVYTPANGWILEYEIRQGSGGDAIKFDSTPDPTNTYFIVKVLPAVTLAWNPGPSVLVGYAKNTLERSSRFGERHEIYYSELTLRPNLDGDTDNVNVTTHAQRMVKNLEEQIENLSKHVLHDTTVEQTRLIRVKRAELKQELDMYVLQVANERALKNVQNGKPSGQKIVPQMNIVSGFPVIGNPIFNGIPFS